MSSWTYITGQVKVYPFGSGQPAKRFVLEEVLDHLPRVWGSEGDMVWHILQEDGYDHSCNHDEFGVRTNLTKHGRRGWWEEQSTYIVVLEGYLRDTCYEDTLRAFAKWLNRLSKRIMVSDMLVRISGYSWLGFWHEHVFNGAGQWKKNYEGWLPKGLEERQSTNWRYGIVPTKTFWPDILVNLVPGGNHLARDWDLVLGNCEEEEYLEWDNDENEYCGVDPYVLGLVEEVYDRVGKTRQALSTISRKDSGAL